MCLFETWRSRLVLGGLALPLLLNAGVPPAVAAGARLADEPQPESGDVAPDAAARQRTIALVNKERIARHLAPLTESATLDVAAQGYAEVLLDDSCFDHSCGPVSDFTARNAQAGYTPWAVLGENIAAGQPTPEAVVAAWMASPGHRDNILRPEFTEIGLGVAHGGAHGTYWAEEFGARPLESHDPED
jgi:uncharacterized protein YkwD